MMNLREPFMPDFMKDLTFQVIDITDRDINPKIQSPSMKEMQEEARRSDTPIRTLLEKYYPREYQVLLSGVTMEGVPVTMEVNGFRPFFFIQIPESDKTGEKTLKNLGIIRQCNFKDIKIGHKKLSFEEFMIRIRNKALVSDDEDIDIEMEELIRSEMDSITGSSGVSSERYGMKKQLNGLVWPPTMEQRRDLYWYRGENVSEQYYRLEFTTKASFYAWRKMLLDPKGHQTIIYPSKEPSFSFKVYEANIEPTLRFIHTTEMPACGWVSIKSGSWELKKTQASDSGSESGSDAGYVEDSCVIHSCCNDYHKIVSLPNQDVAPILIASFDIECDSSHGDFPLAKKQWERIVKTIAQTPTLTAEKIVLALREAIKGKKADNELCEPFGPIYLKNSTLGVSQSKIIEWMSVDMISQVMTLAKTQPDKAQKILLKSAPFNTDVEGDPIIQIGTTFQRKGEVIGKHIITLKSCNAEMVPGSVVVPVMTERDVILRWIELIQETDPDIITGYNITFFDMSYIRDRADELGILKEVESTSLSRFPGIRARYKESVLSSAAMGDNYLKTIEMPGRIILDLCAAVRRNFPSLDSYKLDNVAQNFLFGKITGVVRDSVDDSEHEYSILKIQSKSTFGLIEGGFLHACDDDGDDIGGKLPIVKIDDGNIYVKVQSSDDADYIIEKAKRWTQAKDDVPPSEIFRLQKGSADDRAIIAKYCIQDCVLVLDLLQKLDLVPNAMAMGTVCSVPLSYIFFRGQTIKLASLLFRECEKMGLIVPVLPSPTKQEMNDSYEGAVVLEPKTGLYLEQPVAVLDYGSLYPSSMISENISHDSIVAIWDKNNDGIIVSVKGNDELAKSLPKKKYVDITFDRYEPDPEDKRVNPEKIKVGTRTCRYVQFEDGNKGIIGTILRQLLAKRKESKKRMEKETDPFKKNLLNSLQLAYKVTANSLYGALGAKNSKIRFQDLAASTTAYGRKLLNYAREGLERVYGRGARKDCDAKYVYGDTDSVFVMFQPKHPDGTYMRGKEALARTIELAKEAETILTAPLREPHVLEYEKTFFPFMLFSKKRYIGMKYENDPDHCYQTNMGVVLKRRDNAPIVKEIYQAVVDTILLDRDLSKSVNVAKDILQKLVNGEVSLKKLTITKSLRAHYANPDQIAHKVLAERIGERDPGNKPKPNDRIAFVYFDATKTRDSKKQGDRIETPEFMVTNKLQPDYKHYITNQIEKPLTQLFRLFWSQVPESSPSVSEQKIRLLKAQGRQMLMTEDKINSDIDKAIDKDIQRVIFNTAVRSSIKARVGPMDAFLKNIRVKKNSS